ncbi:hypothetical protein FDECE_7651 [Fusarium decemcellulare]|nr:hypothetical protein FDECE_7651 [Fusarium decemcellulare]
MASVPGGGLEIKKVQLSVHANGCCERSLEEKHFIMIERLIEACLARNPGILLSVEMKGSFEQVSVALQWRYPSRCQADFDLVDKILRLAVPLHNLTATDCWLIEIHLSSSPVQKHSTENGGRDPIVARLEVADILTKQGKWEEAKGNYEEVFQILNNDSRYDHHVITRCTQALREIYKHLGEREKIDEIYQSAARLVMASGKMNVDVTARLGKNMGMIIGMGMVLGIVVLYLIATLWKC